MEEFPSNSNRQKPLSKEEPPEKKNVEKVVSGEVVRRKKPLGKRFAETFVGGDVKSVGSFVLFDVLIPAAKDMVADATSQGVEKMLFGEARSTSRRPRGGGLLGRIDYPGHTPYNRYSSSRPADPRAAAGPSRRSRATHNFEEIILPTRVEAEEVIDQLFELVGKFGSASVADLYDLCGVTGEYTDNKWGWTDLRGAGPTRIRQGYLLELPRPEPLD